MVATLLGLFLSMWWNRYLSPTAGGELTAVFLFEHGWLPYRDYFASAPPGSALLALAIASLFGNHLIAYWAFGAVLRVIGAVVAYLWLCRLVRPVWSAFAVVCAFVLASVDIADMPYFYNHVASTFSLLAAFALSGTLKGSWKRRAAFGLLSGILLGSALIVKQTTGVIVSATLVAVLCLLFGSKRAWRRLAMAIVSLGVGAAIPVLTLLSWFYARGILPEFLDQVFVRGPSSKGGALGSLLRPITLTFRSSNLSTAMLGCFFLVGGGWLAYALTRRSDGRTNPYWWLALIALLVALLVGRNPANVPWDLRTAFLSLAYLAMGGCLSIFLWVAANLLRRRQKKANDPDLILMAAVGFACAYALSISWPAFEVMIFPGVALLFALALDWGGPSRISPMVRGMVVTLLLVLVSAATARKHSAPYYWGRWAEPPLETSTTEPKAPELRGFVLSPWTARFFDDVSETVREHSKPEDRIFVYPNMPMLYALSQRFPATFGLMHWVDVCPDFVAEADAQQLLRSPPAVIIVHPDLPQEIATEELLFREGRQSGVRSVLKALGTIYPRYQVVRVYAVPGHPVPIEVWALQR